MLHLLILYCCSFSLLLSKLLAKCQVVTKGCCVKNNSSFLFIYLFISILVEIIIGKCIFISKSTFSLLNSQD